MTSTLLQGFLLGFSIAAPVGPIGVLCIRRTLADGRLAGFLSGLGAATADMVYGAIAAYGLTAIMDGLVSAQFWLRAGGGLFLLYLGIRTFLAKPASESTPTRSTGLVAAYASTFLLTIANPMTILSFLGVFSALLPPDGAFSPLRLIVGVFLGSAFWWLALSGLVGIVREKFTPAWMQWVNRISGAIIIAFAILTLAKLA
ncbi:MAG: LysE family transporter [Chloroflexi bacterium]|nr:LysE family transporter [Chloroflexota bacterium]